MKIEQPSLDHIKRAIRAFLDRNPAACDTLEGIGRFWVPVARGAELERAIDELVAEGQLVRRTVGKRVHYGLRLGG